MKCLLLLSIRGKSGDNYHKMENVEDFDAIQKRLRDEIAPFKSFNRGESAKGKQSGSSDVTPQNGSQGQMPDFSSILAQLNQTKNNLVNIEDSLEQQRLEVENLMKQL